MTLTQLSMWMSTVSEKEYWQQEYHWHKEVESESNITEKCGVSWCDVYDMTPWKAQCSYEGTGKCGAQAEYEVKQMDKTKVAKMDKEAFRQLTEAEFERDRWKFIAGESREETEKWCNVAGIMHQYLVEGDPEGALRAYERAAWQ